ncbi:MAG: A/G-specific adenine glycosylase [Myxococcota bacterium]
MVESKPPTVQIPKARRALLAYYQRHKRDLPWRRTRDPYHIWVSEIMLQQTQVQTVIPRYHQFLERFPNLKSLASASETEVCEAWAGLGYYRRARHLHAAAQRVQSEQGGQLPSNVADLLKLPGIGRYTAGAIASIAYEQPAPILDGNVMRVLSRVYAIEGDCAAVSVQKELWWLAGKWADGAQPGDLNQALMELGATVCTPYKPGCKACPLKGHCEAFALKTPEKFPKKTAPVKRKNLPIAFAWLQTPKGVWLRRRDLLGLWPGLWELPSAMGVGAKGRLAGELGVPLGRVVMHIEHVLTHRNVRAAIYCPRQLPRWRRREDLQIFAQPLQAPLSVLAKKAIIAMGPHGLAG